MVKITINSVKKTDCPFLYELLGERGPWMNISHREMPSYEDHVNFVMSKPYSKWYIIKTNEQKIGTIYLSKQDEIGIFLKKNMNGKGIGQKALILWSMPQ